MGGVHNSWAHRWVTQKAVCGKSGAHGLGTFAVKPIAKGEYVAVLGGVIVPKQEIGQYRKKMGDVGIQVNEGFFVCPASRRELEKTGVLNHSCEPNVGYADSITFVAIRDISPGEELAFDYAFSESGFEPFECKCSASACRGIIRPTDWKLPGLRKRYSGYFSPYLKRLPSL